MKLALAAIKQAICASHGGFKVRSEVLGFVGAILTQPKVFGDKVQESYQVMEQTEE